MNRLRFVLLGLLARFLQRWATAVAARLEPMIDDRRAAARPDGFPGEPPEHWLRAARPTPPEHWLDVVREGAPQLLDDDGEGVVDWQADGFASSATYDAERAESLQTFDAEWDDRPLAHTDTPPRVYRPPAPARPLRLVEVRSGEPRRTQAPKQVVSRPRAAARLSFRGGMPLASAASPSSSETQRLTGETSLPPENVERANVGVRPFVADELHGGDYGKRETRHEPRQRPTRPTRDGAWAKVKRRFSLRYVRSTLAPVLESVAVDTTALTATPVNLVQRHDFPPSGVRVASHRFPALLDDERESLAADPREYERRHLLDAEQEGRTWSV